MQHMQHMYMQNYETILMQNIKVDNYKKDKYDSIMNWIWVDCVKKVCKLHKLLNVLEIYVVMQHQWTNTCIIIKYCSDITLVRSVASPHESVNKFNINTNTNSSFVNALTINTNSSYINTFTISTNSYLVLWPSQWILIHLLLTLLPIIPIQLLWTHVPFRLIHHLS